METSPLLRKIERALTPTAESLGYELVRLLLVGSGKPTLQIMAERPDGTMGVEDCETLSKAVSAVLDVEDLLDTAYYLEISSPGIDRPLTRLKDFEKHKGFDARVEIEPGINGQKKFKGKLLGLDGKTVRLQDDAGIVHALPFDDVQRAKLLMTDELVASVMKKKQK
jgi:ribosome maturation factor RimP